MRPAPSRARIGSLAATAALTTATLVAGLPPAAAEDVGSELHSLSHEEASGRVRSGDGVFEPGCQRHPYRYRVRPGDTDWSLELFLVDPRGKRVANGYEWKGADPAQGAGQFRFCGQATRPGRFTVRARLTWDDGAYHQKWLEPRRILLRRR